MKKILKKIKWKVVIILVVILSLVGVGANYGIKYIKAKYIDKTEETEVTTATAEIRDSIRNTLSSSGTIEPLNSYDVTSLVSGEIITADFEEGDTVEKGQVLYQIDTDTVDNSIDNSQTTLDRAKESLTKAEESYTKAQDDLSEAQDDYKEAKDKYGDPNYVTQEPGVIKTLFVEEGDKVQEGAQIAQIYDNSVMILSIDFPSEQVDSSLIGKSASIVIDNETLTGKVTKVSSIEETLSGNRVVKQVTIEVKNPGGITATTTATASIGSLYSSAEGTFAVKTDTVITADVSGVIGTIKKTEGSKVTVGDVIYTLTASSIEDQLETYKSKLEAAQDAVDNAQDSIKSAKESIEDAESNLEDVIDTKADYSVTAPISGVIITKSALVGDKVSNTNSASSLCVIYDLSSVTFEMSIDELDVMEVEVGQEVEVTADAFEDQTFTGVVTNISLQSTSSQGVTEYPVTVQIDDVGDLLPGMNVTGDIIFEEVTNVLAVPSDALMRGSSGTDVVYVKDASVTEAVGDVPAGFKEVEVTTGITDGDYIEIKSGISEGDVVYEERISESTGMMMGPGGQGGFGGQGGQMPSGTRPSGGGGGMPGQ